MKSNGEEAPTSPPSWSFCSLPNEIVLSCLSFIPRSYYPKLSLVSKSFESLISSRNLVHARYLLSTSEECVCLCIKLPTRYHPRWFSLYKTKNTGNLLVPIPSSYIPHLPVFSIVIGSEYYLLHGRTSTPSSNVLLVTKTPNRNWRHTPSMKVARMNTLVMKVFDEKIYVMGGCEPEESTHWAEVFDIKTQTWQPLPDPGHELRFSSLKEILVWEGKLYVKTDKKHYFYDPEQGSWEVTETRLSPTYKIDNLRYCCLNNKCEWFDSKLQVWKEVKGLDTVSDKKDFIEIAKFGGKLVTFWESPNEGIWCAVITLERRQSEVWGQIESLDKLKVPDSSILMRCVVGRI